MRVLLLDGDTVQSISVLKSLKEIGVKVTIFCENRISYGYTSRFPDKKIIIPSIKKDEAKFVDFLISFLNQNHHEVIIPLYNDSAEILSRHKDRIGNTGTKCAIQAYNIFMMAHNKEQLMEICRINGISHPRTANPMKSSIDYASDYVGFPLLIKPNVSSGAKGIVFVNKKEELKRLFESVKNEYGECTIQEYVNHSGVYYNAMLYRTRNGKFSESVVIKIIRYFPLKGGTSSYCITIDHPEIIKECEKLLNALNWHGFADIDIIEDKYTHDLKIIEINPRIPSSISAAAISGINFPEIIIKDNLDLEIPKYSYNTGKALRFMGLDVMWFIFSPNRFLCRPSWFRFFARDLYYQDGSIKDPIPMIAGFIMGLKKYLNPSFRKSKLE